MPRYYVPYAQEKTTVISHLKSLDALRKKHPELDQYLAGMSQAKPDQLGYVPVRARKQQFTAVVDRNTAELLKLIPIDPSS